MSQSWLKKSVGLIQFRFSYVYKSACFWLIGRKVVSFSCNSLARSCIALCWKKTHFGPKVNFIPPASRAAVQQLYISRSPVSVTAKACSVSTRPVETALPKNISSLLAEIRCAVSSVCRAELLLLKGGRKVIHYQEAKEGFHSCLLSHLNVFHYIILSYGK